MFILLAFSFATKRLCSLRNIVWVAAKAGCSLALESPPLKQNPDCALHSKFSDVLGSWNHWWYFTAKREREQLVEEINHVADAEVFSHKRIVLWPMPCYIFQLRKIKFILFGFSSLSLLCFDFTIYFLYNVKLLSISFLCWSCWTFSIDCVHCITMLCHLLSFHLILIS